MNVVIHYRESHEAANEVARTCMKHGAKVLTVSADIKSREQINKMQEKLEQRDMIPDIIVNNAGISHYGMLSDVSEEDWDHGDECKS